jgi:isopentenyldiphosphate isomerase
MEKWDLYNYNRVKRNRFIYRGEVLSKDEYHIVVNVCVFNSNNQMLIQQRQENKSGWPNMWDLSISGNALFGETSQEAAEREMLEELGLTIDLKGIRPHLTLNYDEGFDDIFLLQEDVDISKLSLQKEEVKDAKWANKEEILQMIESEKFIPYFPHMIELLFDMRWRYGYLK